MHGLIAWCGFFGAWLLVAGPIYQAALELNDEQYHRDEFEQFRQADHRTTVSKWWWLLPPVWFWLSRQQSRRRRAELMAGLSPDAKRTLVDYLGARPAGSTSALVAR